MKLHGVRTWCAVRVLGAAGLASASLSATSGFFNQPALLGIASVLMFGANAYAFLAQRRA